MNQNTTPRRTLNRRAVLGGALGGTLALAGTGAWAANRYLIEHVEVTDASARYDAASAAPTTTAASTSATTSTTPTTTATSYTGSSGKVTIETVTVGTGNQKVTYFVADVVLASGTALRSAFAKDTFGTNVIEIPSAMATRNNAILAVNGDYYGFRTTGIEIRNGAAFRDKGARQGAAIYRDGTMRLYDETATTAAKLIADGVWQTLSFGPGLVNGGTVIAGIDKVEIDTNVGNHSIQGNQPRTAIGMVSAGHFKLVVVDGRSTGYSRGMTMTELATLMKNLGCTVAYNLDGGGSSAMYFNGDIVNRPQGNDNERGTSDILYVGK
jgi:exopolysaccharide biosynthesis protein